ncbi:MAG: glycosyltransferase [Pseudomonadota bacterium]
MALLPPRAKRTAAKSAPAAVPVRRTPHPRNPHDNPYRMDDPAEPLAVHEKWSLKVFAQLFIYFGFCVMLMTTIPNQIWDVENRTFIYIMGVLGVWRYSWWFNHWMRAIIYERVTFPKIRARAQDFWDSGWRPKRIHVMMTTFREARSTAEAVVRSICSEVRDAGIPATIWIGSSEPEDERVLIEHFRTVGSDCDIELRIIRQNQPGKRIAIALLLRAMSREGLGSEDIVAFMDGDFVLDHGALNKCLPMFAADPELHALTTDEDVVVVGPQWLQSWLSMRFAQRRMAMMSHALSGRVLTLTGRFSVFRATHIVSHDFIRLQEADFLNHWLWGTFRFLSGDDKSTWYALLQHRVKMLYVPDSRGYTIEIIEGSAARRMIENLRRWSGNMLRNGQRAIALGPTKMPFFIWWCCVDQRIAVWTMLFSPMLALALTLKIGVSFLLAYLAYIGVTRGILSLVLFTYARRIDLNFIWTLYVNQVVNAAVKVYMLSRLSKQKWANRGNQKQGFSGNSALQLYREWMARYLTVFMVSALFLAVMSYSKALEMPNWRTVVAFLT